MSKHLNMKPYPCAYCNQSFNDESNRNRHVKKYCKRLNEWKRFGVGGGGSSAGDGGLGGGGGGGGGGSGGGGGGGGGT